MPFSQTLYTVPLHSITVLRDERQRREIQTDELAKSISRVGLIHPIIVRPNGNSLILVAGERRLEACKSLGWTEIQVRHTTDLSEIEAQILELEENAKREELPWPDLVRAVNRIHNLHTQLEPSWTQAQTAEVISQSEGHISMLLTLFPHLDKQIGSKSISECASYREAYNIIKTYEDRRRATIFNDLISDLDDGPKESVVQEPKPQSTITLIQPRAAEEDILHTSFLDWAPQYKGPKFTVLHIDFPYGQSERGPQQINSEPDIYSDSPTIYFKLLDCFCDNLDRFFSRIGWCMFWYSERLGLETREILENKTDLIVQTHPLIWVHSDNVGISPDSRKRPRHIYDTCLLMSRGDIPIATVVADAYSSPTDRSIHPNTKPQPMLTHFFRMLIDHNTRFLDPTCGSASSLRAAEELGAQSVLGLESNESYYKSALRQLQIYRSFASANKQRGFGE